MQRRNPRRRGLLQKLLQGELAARPAQERRAGAFVRRDAGADPCAATGTGPSTAAQVIEELIELAREMREASARGDELRLSEDELAFYDRAWKPTTARFRCWATRRLRRHRPRTGRQTVRRNVTIDWTLRENVRANLRRLVRRVLRKHGYPPDKQEKATQTVLEQAEVLSANWAA